ncbi:MULTISPECIES: D-glycero-beta-D-manno-heptose 1,7-bisphosphate 7-phosphatase [unclassified Mesorhizobium]|uniref:D-glycero-beta-D-manno-heptose 1,7-bisphosphate 7-phosphatase n=1 Tax=unclassified Mesorhizobium TaxID=325217 RepID=UPI000FD8D371|nr:MULTISPECIES: D-glycero-beta-D-manno-heptose 1,7-bisphosphate 7-phosphatase [unclassified Mesorhizobium]TGR37017.1 HAD family hydrolase [bacterium M00.F.Ca.ET.199.01.1.1]TGU18164.1 HAD family hydrolase [bacterium M00.F.Ca.ET.156.01.1.1]TGV82199.1 HAD family hydrolase [Mesorhizobium sp. M00.F.Ca.ET.149.01.1.1]TGR17122.1 HAD family hydrolase [Mesorhizobium sp. M8A.F.Ca.ET.202.01.1.1]TGR18731.1 HAD family hydrolase [Mesorhizobium sp. M8A.F.Ca.ET.197.01.1.1]
MADRIGTPHPLTEPGLWVERIGGRVFPAHLPALFLDRDGTINVDTDYPSDPAEIELRPRMLPAIAAANRRGIPVIVVTNQSGIARGYFGWDIFARVNARVLELLDREGVFVDMVLACAYHEAGIGPLAVADHPMRKPNPGMLIEAGRRLDLDLRRSLMVGDKLADMQAGQRADLAQGWLVDGEAAALQPGFAIRRLHDDRDLGGLLAAVETLGRDRGLSA